uniref:HD domain-containing protein n=1 Tax=Prevotella aurantiaca TaxID=596085 RepID=UPI00235524E7
MIFTDEELKSFHALAEELNKELANDITEKDKEKLASYIKLMEEKGAMERNVFGLSELICAMQTSLIAVRSIGLKHDSVFATVLYAGYENGALEIKQIEKDFGKNVAQIIQGLARIQNLYKKNPIIESENFRNLLLSFAEDMRVILIMIADRVNLMRQIRDTSNKEAQRQVAEEANYLYAPLAHKLGLYQLKSALEDLTLKDLERSAYYQ